LKLSFERINNEMIQISPLKEQITKEKLEAERYKRIAEENSLDLNIVRREMDSMRSMLRDHSELKRRQ
jgi:hypothetical protein